MKKEIKILKTIRIELSILRNAQEVASLQNRSLNSVLRNAIIKGLNNNKKLLK